MEKMSVTTVASSMADGKSQVLSDHIFHLLASPSNPLEYSEFCTPEIAETARETN
jgi:hypothetical protein